MTKMAVLYARKSLKQDRSEEQSASVADQLQRCAQYAADQGWSVVGQHWDDGRSGLLDRTRRRGLDAVMRQVEGDEVDVVVTLWTSRLSRDETQRAAILDDFDVKGVEWHTVADGGKVDRTTFGGYLNYGVRTIFDVAYSKQVKENWQNAHAKRIEQGLPKSAPRHFGYTYEYDLGTNGRRKNGRYVPHEDEAEVVREMYRRYLRGDGFRQIIIWLNAEGWRVDGWTVDRESKKRTRGQTEWTVRTLNRFMDSGFAAGYISRQEDIRDHKRGAHERLIEDDTWQAYLAARAERRGNNNQEGARRRWWLGGLVKCGECGGPTFIDSFQREHSMVCCSNRRSAPTKCGGTYIQRTTVEGVVALWLGGHLDMLSTLTAVEDRETADAAASAYQDALREQERVTDGLSDLAVQKAMKEIDAVTYDAARSKLLKVKKAAEEAVAAAAVQMHAEPTVDLDEVRRGPEDGWTDSQRAALAQIIDRIVVTKTDLTIYPKTGEPMTRTRDELLPRCGIVDCDRKRYTRGLCKSHVMRARSIGGDPLLDALAQRIGDEHPSITVDEVEMILAAAREQNTGVATL